MAATVVDDEGQRKEISGRDIIRETLKASLEDRVLSAVWGPRQCWGGEIQRAKSSFREEPSSILS